MRAMLSLILLAAGLHAQQISGSIFGTVRDKQQALVAGAKVKLVSEAQGFERETTTNSEGYYIFSSLPPAAYSVVIEQPGFKRFERKDIRIFASDRIEVSTDMEIGQVTETILVEGEVSTVQTVGAERSGVLTGNQVVDLALINRSFLDLVRVVPGVVFTGGLGGIQANGNRGNQNNLTVDGVTNVDTGSNGGELATLNIDQMAEFKVTTNAQPAEFGRSSGAQIQVVTKSGGRDFHGSGYIFHRHEGLNANSWRNNLENRARNLYRFNFAGFTIGGPVYIPGKFNKDKNKLFFFVGAEWQNQLVANTLRNVRLPTVAERSGDFSTSVEGGGAAVRVIDPLTGAPFPGMRIPASRFNADGQRILNFYPTPNAEGRDPSFNHQTQISHAFPRREQIFRGDYNISDKWRLYSRFLRTRSEQNMPYGQWNADYNVPFGPMNFGNPGWSLINNLTTVVNPTLTNEFIFGSSKNVLNIDPVDDAFQRSKLNLSYRMPFPDADGLGLVQNWRFGGVPNSPFTSFAGTPFRNFNHTWDITDNATKVLGSHTFKGGIYIQFSQKDQTAFTSINGDIWFDRDASNPGDTNWAYSNALIGSFQRLAQSNQALNGQYRYWNVEWFVQDSWRVNRRLTIDYGLRFYLINPQYDKALQTSSFNPELYNRASAGILRTPGLNSAGQRVSINPVNGEIGAAALIGTIVNTGRGFTGPLYSNGMGRAGLDNYPKGLIDNRGLHYAPRLGIAYSVSEKTVVRAGGGVFYDRFQGNPVFDMLPNPPSTTRPTFFYGNLSSIPSASAGIFAPASVNGFDRQGHIPTTYNWNLSVQRQLPYNFVIDVGYVGSRSLHNIIRNNYNTVPLGSAWLPGNQDPTNPNPQFDGSTTKPINLYRPFPGYENVNVLGFAGFSRYNSLQVSANKRFGNGLIYTLAYTWGRATGVGSGDGDFIHPVNFRLANLGPLSFDVPHRIAMSWVYDLPKLARAGSAFNNPVTRVVFNGWQVSGIFERQSGNPQNLGFSIDGLGNLNERYTGSVNIAPRVVISDDPHRTPRTLESQVDPSVFRLPTLRGATGWEHGFFPARLPAWYNVDFSVFKNVPLVGEQKYIQLRLEMFNALNNPQFNGMNTGMVFRNGAVINTPTSLGGTGGRFGFGALTGTRDPRRIQLAAKIYF
jgi:hypothetical protein